MLHWAVHLSNKVTEILEIKREAAQHGSGAPQAALKVQGTATLPTTVPCGKWQAWTLCSASYDVASSCQHVRQPWAAQVPPLISPCSRASRSARLARISWPSWFRGLSSCSPWA